MIRISSMGTKGKKSWTNIFKKTPAVSVEEFRFAFNLAMSAASLDMPVENPETFGVDLLANDGGITKVRFTDRPMNRAMLAIGNHCSGDTEKAWAIMTRYLALQGLPFLEPWLVSEDGMIRIHDAVIDAAADCPVNGSGDFDAGAFYTHVAELVSGGAYEDDEEPGTPETGPKAQ
jgi:hypothetical protein